MQICTNEKSYKQIAKIQLNKMKTISNPQTKYELELRVLKITEIIYRYALMRHRYSKQIAKIHFNKMKISRSQTRHELELRALKITQITYRYVLMSNRLKISKLRKFIFVK